MAEFYVYAYLREDGTPYYVGKGSGYRAYSSQHRVSPPTDKTRIVLWQTDLTEEDAYSLEKAYIKLFGRKDLGTGVLRNMSNGGNSGSSGYKHSEERRERISKTRIANGNDWSHNKGRKPSEETKRKLSEAAKKRHTPLSEETKKKLSLAARKQWAKIRAGG